jgi:hypothetical protein
MQYRINIARTAIRDTTLTIQADNPQQAKQLAHQQAPHLHFPHNTSTHTYEITDILELPAYEATEDHTQPTQVRPEPKDDNNPYAKHPIILTHLTTTNTQITLCGQSTLNWDRYWADPQQPTQHIDCPTCLKNFPTHSRECDQLNPNTPN